MRPVTLAAVPAPGEPAPDVRLRSHDGEWIHLAGLRGERVLLYFYPEDDTPGCTAQACGLRDRLADLDGVTVLGVSLDGPESHARFRARYSLPFTLLADVDREAASAYGVLRRRSRLSWAWSVERTSFLIGPAGTVECVWRNVSPTDHARLVAEALAALEAGGELPAPPASEPGAAERFRPSSWASVFPGLPPYAYLRRGGRPPFPLDQPSCRLFAFGRSALWHGLRAIRLEAGDGVLAPAYHHGSEIEVMERQGLGLCFYDAAPGLEPDPDELESALAPGVRALYLIHYLGFPQDAGRWRRWCDERGLLLIEDAAMAWPAERAGRPVGSWGDVAIFSPWKTLGLPNLGALICPDPPASATARGGAVGVLRGHAEWLAHRSAPAARYRWARSMRYGFSSAEEFAVGDPDEPVARVSRALARRLPAADAAARRRANHASLLEGLRHRVPPPFDRPTPGSCPFALPVVAADKQALIGHLRLHGIRAMDLWSVPHPSLHVEAFPGARSLRASIVVLPVHQDLRGRDLARIADAMAAAPDDAATGPRAAPQ
jgi:peroxiredoxin/dTDP-4-amino-4,6-dideoxygalactose transaminase